MTMSVLAAVIIAITLPLSYGFVKFVSLLYKVHASDTKRLSNYVARRQRYQKYFE